MKKSSILIVRNKKNEILLLKRGSQTDWRPNCFAYPGGKVDQGEAYERAAVRELMEETNLVVKKMRFIGLLNVKQRFFLVTEYEGVVDLEKASHGFEHTEHKWVSPEELHAMENVAPEAIYGYNLINRGYAFVF